MIARTGAVLLVASAASLAGCTGSDPASSATSGPAGSSAPSVTVTATVTSSPPSPGSSSGSPTVAGPPRCDAPALTVGVGASQGAAGTTYRTLVFRNGGEQPCYLRGFPGASAADAAGKGVVDATRDTSRPAVKVVLDPGRAAHAVLATSNIAPTGKPCPTYPTLLVTPPDSRRTQTVTVDVSPCGNRMRISVVQPGEG